MSTVSKSTEQEAFIEHFRELGCIVYTPPAPETFVLLDGAERKNASIRCTINGAQVQAIFVVYNQAYNKLIVDLNDPNSIDDLDSFISRNLLCDESSPLS